LTSDAEKLRDENDVIPLKDPKSRHRGGHKGKEDKEEDKEKPNDEVLEPAQRIRRPKIGNSTEEELVPLEGKEEEMINVGTSEVSSDTVDPAVKPDLLSQPLRGGPHRDGEHGEHGENEHGEHGENEHGEHGEHRGDDDDHHGKKEKGHKKHGGHDKDD